VQVPGGQLASSDCFGGPWRRPGVIQGSHYLPTYGCAPTPRRMYVRVSVLNCTTLTNAAWGAFLQSEGGGLYKDTSKHEDEEEKSLRKREG
jgi:hypothetical protein